MNLGLHEMSSRWTSLQHVHRSLKPLLDFPQLQEQDDPSCRKQNSVITEPKYMKLGDTVQRTESESIRDSCKVMQYEEFVLEDCGFLSIKHSNSLAAVSINYFYFQKL